jgi:hypothetical protein
MKKIVLSKGSLSEDDLLELMMNLVAKRLIEPKESQALFKEFKAEREKDLQKERDQKEKVRTEKEAAEEANQNPALETIVRIF